MSCADRAAPIPGGRNLLRQHPRGARSGGGERWRHDPRVSTGAVVSQRSRLVAAIDGLTGRGGQQGSYRGQSFSSGLFLLGQGCDVPQDALMDGATIGLRAVAGVTCLGGVALSRSCSRRREAVSLLYARARSTRVSRSGRSGLHRR